VRKSDEDYVSELAETIIAKRTIQAQRGTMQAQPEYLSLWKPEPLLPSFPPSELHRRLEALHLNDTGNKHGVVMLNRGVRLGRSFPPHQPLPEEHVHIIAQLPPPS
jgi:hypothetical protein